VFPTRGAASGTTAAFDIIRTHVSGRCAAEGKLAYLLPSGKRITHASDILFDVRRSTAESRAHRHISLEIKHTSAVTDQFKCRAFDMLHLKKEFGPALIGVLLFARAGQGIGFEQARAISYPFDAFVAVDLLTMEPASWWDEIVEIIERQLDAS